MKGALRRISIAGIGNALTLSILVGQIPPGTNSAWRNPDLRMAKKELGPRNRIETSLLRSAGQTLVSGWALQSSGTINDLFGVSFVSSSVGTAVGAAGTIVKTTNAGTTWINQSSGSSQDLIAVSSTDARNCTAVGINGTILRTTDGGRTWHGQTSGTSNHLWEVSFIDSLVGTTVGQNGVILRTTDGGSNWLQQTSGTTEWLESVCFTDQAHGTAVGSNGKIIRTTDGGDTWIAQVSGTSMQLVGVSFLDSNIGTAVGADTPDVGIILHTTNGGTSWTIEANRTVSGLISVAQISANNATVVGLEGTILRTTDGGLTWTIQTTGVKTELDAVSFPDSHDGTVVGRGGMILHTITGGADIPGISVVSPAGGEIWPVGSTQEIIWMSSSVTNVEIELSTNNGANWSTIVASTPASLGSYAWVIPNISSTQCKVRISDPSNASVSGISSVGFSIVSAVNSSLSYSDFSSIAGLNMVGSTAQSSNALRLTPAIGWQRGAVWFGTEQSVSTGFVSTFHFQITAADGFYGGADGLAFVIQNSDQSALGGEGEGIGYGDGNGQSGIPNSIAIEFDTFQNSFDPNRNHISIQTRGQLPNSPDEAYSMGLVTPATSMADGNVHAVKIEYAVGRLSVYFDNANDPILQVSVDLSKLLALNSGAAWVGFTSATADGYENHDILDWQFNAITKPSDYLSLKQDIINSFDSAGVYGPVEQSAQDYLNTLRGEVQNGTASTDELESMERLFLAENIAKVGYTYADTLSTIAARGFLTGGLDLMMYVIGKTIDVTKLPIIGPLITSGQAKLVEAFDKSMTIFAISIPITWSSLSNGSKDFLLDGASTAIQEFGSGPLAPEMNWILQETKEALFMNLYRYVSTPSMQQAVALAVQRPYTFTPGQVYSAQTNLIALEDWMSTRGNASIAFGNGVLTVSDAISKVTEMAVIGGTIGTLAIGLFYPPALAAALAGLGAEYEFIENVNVANDLLALGNSAFLTGAVLGVSGDVQSGMLLSFDQMPGITSIVSTQSSRITPSPRAARPHVHPNQFRPLNRENISVVSSASDSLTGVLAGIKQNATLRQFSQISLLLDRFGLAEQKYSQAVDVSSAPILASKVTADSTVVAYDSLYFRRLGSALLRYQHRTSTLYLALAQCASDTTRQDGFDAVIAQIDTLSKWIGIQDSEIAVSTNVLIASGVSAPPVVLIESTSYPEFVDANNSFLLLSTIKNAGQVSVSNVSVQIVLNNSSIVTSAPLLNVGSLGPLGEAKVQWSITATGKDSVIVGSIKVLPDTLQMSYTTQSGAHFVIATRLVTSVEGTIKGGLPQSFSLSQNYPNPFNPTTTIRYGLPQRSSIALSVFNTLGQKIRTLVQEAEDAGYHEVKFDGRNLASGVYFYRLQAGSFVQTRKLLLVR